MSRDYSASIGFGPDSIGMSVGKDGVGFSFSVGPNIGFTGSTSTPQEEKIDLSGDSTKEIYHHDFKSYCFERIIIVCFVFLLSFGVCFFIFTYKGLEDLK